MHGRVVLITGATDGIGRLSAGRLAARGAAVLLHGRHAERCAGVKAEIERATGNRKIFTYTADLADLAQVRSLGAAILKEHPRLDVLVNNAGIGPGPARNPRALSAQGFELRLAVNYLAPFLLTHLLLPALRRAPAARIVNVTSAAQQTIDFDDPMLTRHYSPMRAYAQSKLALTMFTFDLAETLRDTPITVNCLHPGTLLDTKMVREAFAAPLGNPRSGAEAEVHLATDPHLEAVSGKYFFEKQEARAEAQAYDREARRKLRALSAGWVGLADGSDSSAG
jgi:NAD(P)-dependent dehydrogenase (short-subunit alcohol dehydrogenase family)